MHIVTFGFTMAEHHFLQVDLLMLTVAQHHFLQVDFLMLSQMFYSIRTIHCIRTVVSLSGHVYVYVYDSYGYGYCSGMHENQGDDSHSQA